MGTSGWKRRTSEQPYNTLQECVVPYGLQSYYNTPSMMSVFVLLASVGTQWGNDANGSLDTEHQRVPVFLFCFIFLLVVIVRCSQHICLSGFNTLFVVMQQPEDLKKSNLALGGILISAETIIIIFSPPTRLLFAVHCWRATSAYTWKWHCADYFTQLRSAVIVGIILLPRSWDWHLLLYFLFFFFFSIYQYI